MHCAKAAVDIIVNEIVATAVRMSLFMYPPKARAEAGILSFRLRTQFLALYLNER